MRKDRVRVMRILFFHFRFVTGLRVRLAPKYNRDDALEGGLGMGLGTGLAPCSRQSPHYQGSRKIFHACQLKRASNLH
jgi:hypothetical protein